MHSLKLKNILNEDFEINLILMMKKQTAMLGFDECSNGGHKEICFHPVMKNLEV